MPDTAGFEMITSAFSFEGVEAYEFDFSIWGVLGTLLLLSTRKMAGSNLRQEQTTFVRNMVQQGVLDIYVEDVLDLRNVESPQFLIDVINTFCRDGEICIGQLGGHLSEPVIDYPKATAVVHQFRGSCSSMGGRRAAGALRALRVACDGMAKERCLELFEHVKEEFKILKETLGTIAQVEMTIIMSGEGGGPHQ